MKKATKTVKIDFEQYMELMEAKMQRDIMLNIAQNASQYNVAEYIKAAFNIELKEQD